MGDRNNPIKFGPEWLRNFTPERNSNSSLNNSQNITTTATTSTTLTPTTSSAGYAVASRTLSTISGPVGTSGTVVCSGGTTQSTSGSSYSSANSASGGNPSMFSNNIPNVLIARQRYGKEEMLAFYDKTSQPPEELQYHDVLYKLGARSPVELNSTVENTRNNSRGTTSTGSTMQGERFNPGRDVGRNTSNIPDNRSKSRGQFARQPPPARSSWQLSNPRTFGSGTEDVNPLRPWGSNNNIMPSTSRITSDQQDGNPNRTYRRRQFYNTNWRQPQSREEGDRWRSSDVARIRHNVDRWNRDWGERASQDRAQSWNTNRRTSTGGERQTDDNMPEWADDNTVSVGGTFDAAGAFHGYSSDDTCSSKALNNTCTNQLQGTFVRSNTDEERSEEWWASDSSKKLTEKKIVDNINKSKEVQNNEGNANKFAKDKLYTIDNLDNPHLDKIVNSSNTTECLENTNTNKNFKSRTFTRNKTYDILERSDNDVEVSDDTGNFQSVMITQNNSLRQKHQHIVASLSGDNSSRRSQNSSVEIFHSTPNDSKQSPDKLIEHILDLTLEDSRTQSANLTSKSGDSQAVGTRTEEKHSAGKQHGEIQMNCIQPSAVQSNSTQAGDLQSSGNQVAGMSLGGIQTNKMLSSDLLPSSMPQGATQARVFHPGGMQLGGIQVSAMQNSGMQQVIQQNIMQQTGMQQGGGLQSVLQPESCYLTQNPALNSALGLSFNNGSMLPMQGVPTTALPNTAPGLGSSGLQGRNSIMPGFASSSLSMISSAVQNSTMFLGQNTNLMQSPNDPQLPNRGSQSNLLNMHNLQLANSQASFGSIYNNVIPVSPGQPSQSTQNLADQWYYQDPEKIIQGPFSSKEMYKWYIAGFFSSSLLVRRACETQMRPLGSYGPVVPFTQHELQPFYTSNSFANRTQYSYGFLNSGVGLQDSLWNQLSNADLLWMPPTVHLHGREESPINRLPLYFWETMPSNITSSSLLNEDITKDIKTEDQILEQLRASQNGNTTQTLPFINDQTSVPTSISNKPDESYSPNAGATPNLEELQKLIQTEVQESTSSVTNKQSKLENKNTEVKAEESPKEEQNSQENNLKQQQNQIKITTETKLVKTNKTEIDKNSKSKDNSSTKSKTKKAKEEKKDDVVEMKKKEGEAVKTEQKRSTETSPSRGKKEDKQNKKELEKERKEWIKEGFTVVKGYDKNTAKENKKKVEEAKCSNDTERKRKEEEKVAIEDKKEKKHSENQRKQQDPLEMCGPFFDELAAKKSAWSAIATQAQSIPMDCITLTEIQRLEREKKMEQVKEQQQMMQIIAQQQAAVVAREQEIQAGFGWATKRGSQNIQAKAFMEIQTETNKQPIAAANTASTATTQILEQIPSSNAAVPNVPWGPRGNSATGFWDTKKIEEKTQGTQNFGATKKNKKKNIVSTTTTSKTETTPADEFDLWCNNILSVWCSNIDVPTFVEFLKDLESPYEVKDYVKLYLGESKDANDFARLFLEKRSKLLREDVVIPSDDLCSPAVAVNPRPNTNSSEYQELKKKGKKKKMQKVDSRILGFLVTASQDRINIGDIDTP